jgi:hypothetical protein
LSHPFLFLSHSVFFFVFFPLFSLPFHLFLSSSFPCIIFVRTKLWGDKPRQKGYLYIYIYFWARQRHNDIEFWRRLMCCCRCFAHVAKHDLLNFDVNMNLTIFFACLDKSNCG